MSIEYYQVVLRPTHQAKKKQQQQRSEVQRSWIFISISTVYWGTFFTLSVVYISMNWKGGRYRWCLLGFGQNYTYCIGLTGFVCWILRFVQDSHANPYRLFGLCRKGERNRWWILRFGQYDSILYRVNWFCLVCVEKAVGIDGGY
jgi:hypothetical protein